MAIPKMEEDVEVISKLGDIPGSDDGLTTQELKHRFDLGAVLIKDFINNVLLPGIENAVDEDGLLSKVAQAINGKLSLSGGTMTGALNMGGKSLSNLKTPAQDTDATTKKYVDDAKAAAISSAVNDAGTNAANIVKSETDRTNTEVRKASPRNLLDNSDFRNPVNQRGITTSNAVGYTIDRWVNPTYIRPKWTVSDGYVSLQNDLTDSYRTFQRLTAGTLKAGTRYTAAAKIHNGNVFSCVLEAPASGDKYSSRFDDSFYLGLSKSTDHDVFYISITAGNTIPIEWVALYEGEYTADTLPEYQPKGYGAELLECMRYFQVIRCIGTYYTPMAFGTCVSDTSVRFAIPLAAPMREGLVPSIVKNTCTGMHIYGNGQNYEFDDVDISVQSSTGRIPTNTVIINAATTGIPWNYAYTLVLESGEIWFSKEL